MAPLDLNFLNGSGVLLLRQNIEALSESQIHCFEQSLSGATLARLDRYKFAKDRLRGLVAQGLRNLGLQSLLGIECGLLEFETGAHGKPVLAASIQPRVHFNASHSGNWVVVAFAAEELGVDVETFERKNDIHAIADRYFHGSELEQLRSSGARFREHFFDLWTLKESYMKARGEGLSLGLSKFGFIRQQDATYLLEVSAELEDSHANWHFLLDSPDSSHRLALALARTAAARSGPEFSDLPQVKVMSHDPDRGFVSEELHAKPRFFS